jgi:hypothetical protein
MPDERQDLITDLEHAHAGDPWHGSSRAAILRDVTARDAAARVGEAHTIWELVLHMTSWTREVARRVREGEARMPEMGDWPEVQTTSDAAWRASLRDLDAAHRDVLDALQSFPPGRLADRVGQGRDAPLGSGITFAAMLRGLAQHDAYHSGQIAILKKLVK